jgi:glucan phosphoethanolaminetransferase (alkaline phosphatase superfamily)
LPSVYGNYVPSKLFSPIKSTGFDWLITVLLIQVILLICMLYFRRYAVIKTILVVTFIVFAYNGLLSKINEFFLVPDGWKSLEQNFYKITNEGYEEYFEIKSAAWLNLWVDNAFLPVWALLWVVLYFQIKEQEA